MWYVIWGLTCLRYANHASMILTLRFWVRSLFLVIRSSITVLVLIVGMVGLRYYIGTVWMAIQKPTKSANEQVSPTSYYRVCSWKTVAIRSKLAGHTVSPAVTKRAAHSSSTSYDFVTLSEFQPLSEEAVRKMAMAFMKTCTRDPLPCSRMVNVSLEYDYFADDWKRALVHPLLEKSGLQLINKNFWPWVIYSLCPNSQRKRLHVQLQEHMLPRTP